MFIPKLIVSVCVRKNEGERQKEALIAVQCGVFVYTHMYINR